MNSKKSLPLIPLRGMTVFPSMVIHFDVGREKSIAAVEAAMINEEDIFLVSQIDEDIEEPNSNDINQIGTVCKIKQIIKLPEKTVRVLVEGKERAKIEEFIKEDTYFEVIVSNCENTNKDEVVLQSLLKLLKERFVEYLLISGDGNKDMVLSVEGENDIFTFSDVVASYVTVRDEDKQEILESIDIENRVEKLLKLISKECEIMMMQKKIASKVKYNLDNNQKEYYLREQLRVIQEELGDGEEEEIRKFEGKIKKSKMPKEAKNKAKSELNRLRGLSFSSSEGNTIRSYLNWLLDIPWGKVKKDNFKISEVEDILNLEHYGMEEVKERILEFLTVMKLSSNLKSNILCLVGPPGVGKTSIAKSIAKALNRDYARMSLGGLKDEAEIRGHRRTYVGAIPGRFVYALKEAGSMNPIILLDEIDKLSVSYKGDPADALLEVLDNEQNSTFRDNYLEVPLDLSKVLFITTANSLHDIPGPLMDRMDVISLSGYTYEEKYHIAKKHLLKKIYNEYNLSEEEITITDNGLKELIDGYTKESGVRGLERKLKELFRKALRLREKEGNEKLVISNKYIVKLLGEKKFTYDSTDLQDKIGVVTGLAWTAYGGDTLPVEAIVMNGNGKLQLTGKLGDVMQESAKAAYTYVRANAEKLGIDKDFYKSKDIHIHVPEGAVPKDGPSAGVTMVTSLVSALTGRKIKGNIAMTGEVTITGRVLAIGGLKEKSLAAYRAGINHIIIPKENEKDIKDIPDSIKRKLMITKASKVDEVLDIAIMECV